MRGYKLIYGVELTIENFVELYPDIKVTPELNVDKINETIDIAFCEIFMKSGLIYLGYCMFEELYKDKITVYESDLDYLQKSAKKHKKATQSLQDVKEIVDMELKWILEKFDMVIKIYKICT